MKHTPTLFAVVFTLVFAGAPHALAEKPPQDVVVTNFPLDEEGNLRVNGQVEGALFSLGRLSLRSEETQGVSVPESAPGSLSAHSSLWRSRSTCRGSVSA